MRRASTSTPALRASQTFFPAPVPKRMQRFRPAVLALSMAAAFASLPTASQNVLPVFRGNVVGTATPVTNAAGTQMQVTTTNGVGANHSATNWNSFSIGAANGVRIDQPNAASMSINRVVTNTPSQIFGTLSSNGKLVLVNQSGITVGAGAVVDSAGFTASVLGMSEADAAAGRLRFNADGLSGGNGALRVEGNIIARGGDVVLIAPNIEVAKTAVVEAQNGTAILAAGQRVEVTGRGLEGIVLQVQAPTDRAVNLGTLKGDAVGIFAGQLRHSGAIVANGVTLEGGRVVLRATDLAEVNGTIEASRTLNGVTSGGTVEISGRLASLNGTVDVRGSAGGAVTVTGQAILQGGQIDASGQIMGGSVQIVAQQYVEQTAGVQLRAESSLGAGGTVRVEATNVDGAILSSATISADGATGGSVVVAAPTIRLQAATVTAEGSGSVAGNGGSIKIGGGRQGNDPGVPNSHDVFINNATNISASSRRNGRGGTVVVWSDGATRYAGSIKAQGGSESGDGGFVEVSGKESLTFSGMADASAPHGARGTLLLDPKNILIQNGGGSALGLDPDPEPATQTGDFGATVFTMNDKLVVTDPLNDLAGMTDSGAVYVFDVATGALVGSLKGSSTNDRVGQNITESPFNSYSQLMLSTPSWTNGTLASAGAVTFISPGSFAGSAVVSAANSYVGTNAGDQVGYYAPQSISAASGMALLFGTPDWAGGKGAIFKVTQTQAASGVGFGVDASTALVGKVTTDRIGQWGSYSGYTTLYKLYYGGGQDQFLLGYAGFDGGKGAVTLGNVNLPLVGEIGDSAMNFTLRGSTTGDQVGSSVIMTNQYGSATDWIVKSPNWANGTLSNAGAVTVIRAADTGNFAAPANGVVSASNSIVSDVASAYLGDSLSYAEGSGYFLVVASGWNSGRGAVTWSSIAAPKTGVVSGANSLVGANAGDNVGATVDQYGSGVSTKYVVRSPGWQYDNGASLDSNAGAITVIGSSNVAGAVSASNSLIGTHQGDRIGDDVEGLSAQGYVYSAASNWAGGRGAVTLINLSSPVKGEVSASNSLVGTLSTDNVGSYVIDNSYNGYLLSLASNWGNTGSGGKGAVTFIPLSGVGGVGEVSAVNSLVGYAPLDNIGGSFSNLSQPLYTYSSPRAGVELLYDGSYLVRAPQWNNSAGMVAYGSRTGGVVGELNPATAASIALVGRNTGDKLGERVASYYDGSYVVFTPNWATDRGAITWGAAGSGVAGQVDDPGVASLYGTVGSNFATHTFNFNEYYASRALVLTPGWDGGKGALTLIGYNAPASTGQVSGANSLVGSLVGDYFGCVASCTPSGGTIATPLNLGGNWWAVGSPYSNMSAGAITFIGSSSSVTLLGDYSSSGSGYQGDRYGLDVATQVFPRQYTNYASSDGSGKVAVVNATGSNGRGAVTMLDLNQMSGFLQVNASTSLLGATANTYSNGTLSSSGDALGSSFNAYSDWTKDKNYLILKDAAWQGNKGYVALTGWTPDANPPSAFGTTGTLSSANAFTGTVAGDMIGSGLVTQVGNKLLIVSSDWGNGLGAASLLNVNNVRGTVDNSLTGNSMTGSGTSSHFGAGTTANHVAQLGNSVVLASPGWEGNRGAITWINMSSPGGTVSSASNSLVGDTSADQVGSGGLIGIGTERTQAIGGFTSTAPLPFTLALSSNWSGGKGAITRIDETPVFGTLGSTNSFVGDISGGEGDRVGSQISCSAYGCSNLAVVNGAVVMRTDRSSDFQSYITVFTPDSKFKGTLNSASSMQFASTELSGVQLNVYGDQVMMRLPNWGGGKGAIRVFDTHATQVGDNTLTATANTGLTDATNALVGGTAGDRVGESANYYGPVVDLNNGKYLIFSRYWDGNKGAVTEFDLGAAQVIPKGVLSSANSLVGTSSNDFGGAANGYYEYFTGWVHKFSNGSFLLGNNYFSGGQGSVTFMQADASANKGVLGAANSLVGGAGNTSGYFYFSALGPYDYSTGGYHSLLVTNPSWMGGKGMATVFNENGAGNPLGEVTDLNSLVGSTAGDSVGSRIISSGVGANTFVVTSENWNGDRGAITWGTIGSGVASLTRGAVSAANSLVGSQSGDRVGSALSGEGYERPVGILAGTTDRYYVVTPHYNGDLGAYTFINKGATGTINDGNSLVGTYAGGLLLSYNGYELQPEYLAADRYMVKFGGSRLSADGPGQIYLVNGLPGTNGAYFGGTAFGDMPDQSVTITPQRITSMLEMGTNVLLQANNDISVNAAIYTNSSFASGSLQLEAGRSIAINADISLYGGDLSFSANHGGADQNFRDAGAGGISMGSGANIYLNGGSLLAAVGAGTNGGNIDLGNIYYGASMYVANYSTAPNAGITQIPGATWDVQKLAMLTASTSGNIGTLLQPITFTGDLLAVQSAGGSAGIHSLAESLNIMAESPVYTLTAVSSSPVDTEPPFRGISLAGNGSLNLRSEGSVYLQSSDAPISIEARNIVIEAPNGSLYVSAYDAPAGINARGELQLIVGQDIQISGGSPGAAAGLKSGLSADIVAGGMISLQAGAGPAEIVVGRDLFMRAGTDISIQGGDASGAHASVLVTRNADIIAGETVLLRGGSGADTYALFDPMQTGSTMSISAGNVSLVGGSGANSYAAIVSSGGPLTLTGGPVTLEAGAGVNADALILAPNAQVLSTGAGFGYLGVGDPRYNGVSDAGFGTVFVTSDVTQQQFLSDQNFITDFLDHYNDELLRQRRRALKGDIVLQETCK